MSRLKSKGYGDGRTTGAMPDGTFMDEERWDYLPSGISVQGIVSQLEGQPPIAHAGSWGNLSWARNWRDGF